MGDKIIFMIFEHAVTQMKRWHHYTANYAEHMALGAFYEGLATFEDSFMETYIGIYGRLQNEDFSMKFQKYFQGASMQYLKQFNVKLQNLRNSIEDTTLQNMLDEILGLSKKTIYLLTLA